MFTGFTERAQEFLWGIRMNNEREWFLAHKREFIDYVQTPMNALAEEVFRQFEAKHRKLGLEVHVSRIYRDARRLFGRGPYKDHLWLSLRPPKPDRWMLRPEFWFGLEPEGYVYGMGMYAAKPVMMELFRKEMDENPKRILTLTRKLDRHPDLKICGEEYKRPKGSVPPPLDQWYNRKAPDIECCRGWDKTLESPELVSQLAEAFDFLVPYFLYFNELCIRLEA